jgi:hypothetical protein
MLKYKYFYFNFNWGKNMIHVKYGNESETDAHMQNLEGKCQ